MGVMDRDFAGVCATTTLLTSDRDNVFIFLLGFENEELSVLKITTT